MDVALTGPVALAERRLAWLDARQRVLARNIANADTPGFRPSDLAPFSQTLARQAPGRMQATHPLHLGPVGGPLGARTDRAALERTPNGNAVSLDEQALRVADTDQQHAMAMGLHRKYLALFRTALGRTS
jgi:flagellar basal-body rod protein FlgB